jgi:hypothetical protein
VGLQVVEEDFLHSLLAQAATSRPARVPPRPPLCLLAPPPPQ